MKKRFYAVSNAHLDTQWNWTIQYTIRKCIKNTLEENFRNFRQAPKYLFNFEGAFRYKLMQEYYPKHYDLVKQYVAEGRWHPCGAFWDSCDVNVPSSEALMRQALLGNKYFEKEFNNQLDTATYIEFKREYQGNLFGIDDEDIYTFTLTEPCGVTLSFTDTYSTRKGHYSVWVSDGENIVFEEDECGSFTTAPNLDKGTYYLSVSSLGRDRFTNMAYKIKVVPDKNLAIHPSEEDTNAGENEPDEKEKEFRFDDVNETSWYYNDVMEAYREGLVEGVPTTEMYGGHIYSPDVGVSIAEAITMAVRAHSKKYDIEYEYAHTGDKWYDFYVDYAKKYGIIKKNFSDYGKKATRAEVAYIFSNLFNDIETEKNTVIPDVNENTEYYDEIHKLYALGIFKGDDEKGTFYPERNLTRAEAAVILLRVHKAK